MATKLSINISRNLTVYQWMHLLQLAKLGIIDKRMVYQRIQQDSHQTNAHAFKCLQFSTLWWYSFGVSIAIIFSIINISISDKCACICLHQYLYIFHIKTHNHHGGWSGQERETRTELHSSISRSDFNYRCIFMCMFFCAIILRHFDGKC